MFFYNWIALLSFQRNLISLSFAWVFCNLWIHVMTSSWLALFFPLVCSLSEISLFSSIFKVESNFCVNCIFWHVLLTNWRNFSRNLLGSLNFQHILALVYLNAARLCLVLNHLIMAMVIVSLHSLVFFLLHTICSMKNIKDRVRSCM